MQYIDTQLRRLQGQKDPLQRIAAEFSKKNRLLCFDEFLVHDVAHAMILAELLDALFARGVILVATSNIKPDDLYLNGVQRDRFLPAIALIKAHCTVIHMSDEEDYRLGGEALPGAYVYPLGLKTAQTLARQFAAITSTRDKRGVLTIQNRNIHFIRCGERAVWFDFKDICNLPRSPLDYLELTEYFDTIVVSGVPALTEKDIAQVILLIHFVDVMYDRGIRLIISAAVPLEYLYIEGEMSQTFKRTVSRLQEMQSTGYLKRTMKKLDCQI